MNNFHPDQFVDDPELEDLVISYIEEEVGRYDFATNWERMRKRGRIDGISEWLNSHGSQVHPDTFIKAVDSFVTLNYNKAWSWDR